MPVTRSRGQPAEISEVVGDNEPPVPPQTIRHSATPQSPTATVITQNRSELPREETSRLRRPLTSSNESSPNRVRRYRKPATSMLETSPNRVRSRSELSTEAEKDTRTARSVHKGARPRKADGRRDIDEQIRELQLRLHQLSRQRRQLDTDDSEDEDGCSTDVPMPRRDTNRRDTEEADALRRRKLRSPRLPQHSQPRYGQLEDGYSRDAHVRTWVDSTHDTPVPRREPYHRYGEKDASRWRPRSPHLPPQPQPQPGTSQFAETYRGNTKTERIRETSRSQPKPYIPTDDRQHAILEEMEEELRNFKKKYIKTGVECPPRREKTGTTYSPPAEIRVDSYAITSYVMKLPEFSGDVNSWISYKSIYENSKNSFSKFENIVRLRKSLKGEALECVNILIATNADPDRIVEELHRTYGRSDQMAFREFNVLKDLPNVTDKAKDIVMFARKVRQGVLLFQTLGEERYIFSPELIQYLQAKLPNFMKSKWRKIQAANGSKATLIHFRDFLDEEADSCIADLPLEEKIASTRRTVQRTHTITAENTEVAEERKLTRNGPAAELSCKICNRTGHRSMDCYTFKNADSDRRWELAKQHMLCFRCLKPRSQGHTCKMTKCGTDGCTGTHHKFLHHRKSDRPPKEAVANTWTKVKPQAYLKIVPVTVIGPAGESNEYALLDDGSTVSLMDEEVAEKVGAEGKADPLTVQTMGETMQAHKSRRIEIALAGRQGEKVDVKVRTVPSLNLSPQTVTDKDIAACKHLNKIQKDLVHEDAAPKILIGQDNWNLLLAEEVIKGPETQPIASRTPLGWVLHGAHTRTLGHTVLYTDNRTSDENLNAQLGEYFALDSLMVNPRRPDSDPEKRAENILRENTRFSKENRIETALLWKKEDFVMPNNFENAMKRLTNIEKKLDKDTELKNKYTEQMNALIEKGYAEPAPSKTTQGKTWYLPHFDVKNPAKPDKFRIVHDAAAKTRGVSLNDYLLTGPDLLRSLPGVLMRFRRHNIAVSADIAEMFMQVKIREEDRDALRYLWRGDRREGAPEEYRMTSLIFGAASSPCTAIYVKDWNARRYQKEFPTAVEAITDNHYMDDYLDSFRSTEEAITISKQVQSIHSEAHMELRKWLSNSPAVIEELEPNSNTAKLVNIGSKEEKILGLMWNPSTDQLGFNLGMARLPADILNKETVTKREALKIVMSLYDPLGFASPVTVNAKKILQEAWRKSVDWDQELDKDLANQWIAWKQHLQQLKMVNIPRCYSGFSDAISLQIHTFTDASETAYAAAVYWRAVTPDNRVHVSLVMAKAKVTPLKVTSIPRLELQAAVMGSRMAAAVIEEHRIIPESRTFWTDSKTVLSWVKRGARSYKPFVAHRVAAIEENSKTDEWRWIPTKLNVADVATRDVPPDFGPEHDWFKGPTFLLEDQESWPLEKITVIESTGEERVHICTEAASAPNFKQVVPDPNRFSRWERLVRATARVLQFVKLCRKSSEKTYYKRTVRNKESDPDWRKKYPRKQKRKSTVVPKQPPNRYVTLDAEFVKQAENLLIRASQEDSFGEDIATLRRKEPTNNNRLRALPVEYRDGLIVLRSRIAAVTEVSEEMKSPPVIDGDHRIAQLYIDWTHRSLHHSGTEPTINEVRQHYWVVKLRPAAKKIIGRCLRCRIRKAQPPIPPTGDHPRTRLAHHQKPFTFTGLDYFGPLTVTVGRQHQKRYVALFTCLTTRAVHLEIAASLSADSAVLALRRFAARRGCPTEIHSDNGTNMHAADKELRQALREEASRRGIVWRFITPSAPFMGGAWERLVRCVKTTLYAVLHERHPTEEVLATLLCEAEYTVNSRPLTHVSVDPDDDEAITPNHFLLGGSGRLPTPGTFDENDLVSKKHWRRAQILSDMFWRRWVREYLPELQHRREPHGRGPSYEVGDPVLIADSQLPRNTWPRGRIQAVYPGKDGQVRIVEVRTSGGVLKRPAKKLVPLPK